MNRGRFVTLEGAEGVGKSTNVAFVKHFLEDAGCEVVATREPGGTPLAEAIRGIVLSSWEEEMPAHAELLLMFAARSAHLQNLIEPALTRGAWVVCDRFVDASFAYQGAGRGIPTLQVEQLQEWVLGTLRPDLTLLLDAGIETGRERAGARDRARATSDRIETEQLDFFARVRDAYLALARAEPDRIKVVDAGASLPEVQRKIAVQLQALLDSL